MPASYTINPERRLVTSRGWGALSDDDLRQHDARLRVDPAFSPGYRQLADGRELTRIDVSWSMIAEVARNPVFSRESRRALVVARDVDYGVARVFQTMVELQGGIVQVFRDREAAERWLDRPASS